MLRNLDEITHYDLKATDGVIGRCEDFLFDDGDWVIRYMVANILKWFPGRKVLVSTQSMQLPDSETRSFLITLAQDELVNAPTLEAHEPVSRQFEEAFYKHAAYPYYWLEPDVCNDYPDSRDATHSVPKFRSEILVTNDIHLRSARGMIGYDVYASRGEWVGKVHDFIADDGCWTIRWLVIDTGRWLSGKKVFLASSWTRMVDWVNRCLWLDISKTSIEKSPEMDLGDSFTRIHETQLHEYYQFANNGLVTITPSRNTA